MRTPSVTVVMTGFAAYSYGATVLSVAWYLRRGQPELSLPISLLWSSFTYAPWLAVGLMVWLVLRRSGTGWKAVGVLTGLMVAVVPLIAALGARIDLSFLHQAATQDDWIERTIDRMPIVLLLYTATVAVGLAAAHWRRARDAQGRLDQLTHALAAARQLQHDNARLLVLTGRSRTSVDLRQVEWLASAANYVVVNWDGREGLVRDTLQAMETRLDARLFARIHRSTLVNLAQVKEVQPLSDGSWRLTMRCGADLVVSRTYRDSVLQRLGRTL